MAKLTKAQRKAHAEACKILQKDALSIDEKIFVLENWHEGAEHMNGAIGAHFTPSGLARDFAIDAGGGRRVIELCAGIGQSAGACECQGHGEAGQAKFLGACFHRANSTIFH